MKKYLGFVLVLVALTTSVITMATAPAYAATEGAPCKPKQQVLGLPTWYKYLGGQDFEDSETGVRSCQPVLSSISAVWRIGAAVIDMLLRVAALVAIGFVVYGGISYTLSQGQPDKTKQALQTIINALVGLVIAIVATAVVQFIAGSFKQ